MTNAMGVTNLEDSAYNLHFSFGHNITWPSMIYGFCLPFGIFKAFFLDLYDLCDIIIHKVFAQIKKPVYAFASTRHKSLELVDFKICFN